MSKPRNKRKSKNKKSLPRRSKRRYKNKKSFNKSLKTKRRSKRKIKSKQILDGSDTYDIFIKAIYDNDIVTIRSLLRDGFEINNVENPVYHQTPLFDAVKTNNFDLVEFLLQNRANVNVTDYIGETPLFVAVDRWCNMQIIILLLQYGSNINHLNIFNQTPLFYAIRKCGGYVINNLIRLGADVNITDDLTETPLFIAVKKNDTETSILLLQNGANVNAVDANKKTPLNYAVENQNIEMVKNLLAFDASLNFLDAEVVYTHFFVPFISLLYDLKRYDIIQTLSHDYKDIIQEIRDYLNINERYGE